MDTISKRYNNKSTTGKTFASEEARLEKNTRIAATRKATKARRAQLDCRTFDLKLKPYTREQETKLKLLLLEAKWLRNYYLATNDRETKLSGVPVRLPDGRFEQREFRVIGSQIKQSILEQLDRDKRSLAALKRKGRRIGGLKFEREHRALELKQVGTTYRIHNNQAHLQNLGWLQARGTRQLKDWELSTARLVKQPDGYHLRVTAYGGATQVNLVPDTKVGIDMGLKTHFTLSNGSKIKVSVEESKRARLLRRKLSRQVRKSKGYYRTLGLLKRELQKQGYMKDEIARKLSREFLRNEQVFIQDEQLNSWKRRKRARGGKVIQAGVHGRVKQRLKAHPRVTTLDKWVATTQSCKCGIKTKHSPSERIFQCSSCGFRHDRDVHASRNMIILSPQGLGSALAERVSDDQFWSQLAVKPETLELEAQVLGRAWLSHETAGSSAQL